ncbi:MAG: hypothetical protein AB7N71_03525 [Phycisphaerae bacterium]
MAKHDEHDAMMDRNLRALASRISLPETPSDAQRAAWMRSVGADADALSSNEPSAAPVLRATSEPISHSHGRVESLLHSNQQAENLPKPRKGHFMKQVRFLTIGGIAAALAVAAFFMGPGQPKRVEAATILKSLRTNTWNGLQITIDHLEVEGILVDGECTLRFSQPQSMAQFLAEDDNDLDASDLASIFFDFSVVAGEAAEEDVVGLNIETRGGYWGADTAWVYFRPISLPTALIKEQPMVQMVVNMFQHGMLIDLDQFGNELFSDMHDDDAQDESRDGIRVGVNVNAGTEVSDELDADALEARIERNVAVQIEAGTEDVPAKPGTRIVIHGDEADAELERALKDVLTGDAGQEQIDKLIAELESHVDSVQVQRRADGLHVLIAQGIAQDEELLKDAILELGYREGSGVEWVEIQNMGPRHGNVRVAFTNDSGPNQAMVVREQMIADGVQAVNLQQLMKSFGGMFNMDIELD